MAESQLKFNWIWNLSFKLQQRILNGDQIVRLRLKDKKIELRFYVPSRITFSEKALKGNSEFLILHQQIDGNSVDSVFAFDALLVAHCKLILAKKAGENPICCHH